MEATAAAIAQIASLVLAALGIDCPAPLLTPAATAITNTLETIR